MSDKQVSLAGIGLQVSVPTYDGKVPVEWIEQFNKLYSASQAYKFNMKLAYQSHGALISSNRNLAASQFLDDKEATHLLFIDADILFNADQILKLLAMTQIEEYDYDIVTLPYPIKQDEPKFHLALGDGEVERTKHGLIRSYGAGCGFMMIKKEVFEKMEKAYPELEYYNRRFEKNMTGFFCEGLFDSIVAEDGQGKLYCGEDVSFCRRWMAIGGKIWFDPNETLTHVGTKKYFFTPQALTASFDKVIFKEI